MKRNYDLKHNERLYEPGHLVAVWTPVRKIGKCEKLLRKYFSLYRILKKLSNVNYLIEPKNDPGQDLLITHVSRLKPYFERIDEVTHEDVTTSGEGEVMVELRSVKMQDPAQERIKDEESAKPQPGRVTPPDWGSLSSVSESHPYYMCLHIQRKSRGVSSLYSVVLCLSASVPLTNLSSVLTPLITTANSPQPNPKLPVDSTLAVTPTTG
ncbi:hypothetical protein LAZ67_7002245 [Cordylochernes scorpioides]|uniref:Integrase p58-like C-terminal domain-containing protein n=1 Tax=Cordylochernes scorpioides TaxID=51811 RepID=A0ABY6KMZ1_9ARAC|nr:hypothetical protein LAZ67_7002245 [Cordylochernes scorpioides]